MSPTTASTPTAALRKGRSRIWCWPVEGIRRLGAYDPQIARLLEDRRIRARRAKVTLSGDGLRSAKRGWSHSRRSRISAEDFGGAPDVLEAVVERREAEADQVGRAKIADHAARDQRLHDRIALRVGEDDVAAARPPGRAAKPAGLRRRSAPRPRRRTAATARAPWLRGRAIATPSNVSSPASSAASARIDGVPVRKLSDAVGGPVIVVERERLGMAHPALERRAQFVLQPLGDVEEGRARRARRSDICSRSRPRGRSRLPSRSSSIAPALCDRSHTASAPARMRRVVDRAHVVERGAAVIDVGQGDDRGIVIDRVDDFVWRDRLRASGRASRRALARHRGRSGNCAAGSGSCAGPAARATAAASSLNRQTLVESAISSSFGLAPTIGASLAAMRVGQSIQPCLFQLAMRSSPHCARRLRQRAGVATRQRAERIAVEVDEPVGQAETARAQRPSGSAASSAWAFARAVTAWAASRPSGPYICRRGRRS